jgi:FkbM family methyltransferase
MQLAKSLAKNLRRLRTNYRVKSKVKNSAWVRALIAYGIDPDLLTYDPADNSVFLEPIGLRLDSAEHAFMLKGMEFAQSLFNTADGRFENSNGLINALVAGIRVEVRTFEELFILHEIFVEGAYNVKLAKPVVAVDIGMNVGFSSLHFAANPNISTVYAFEPATVTFQHALRNLALNPALSDKIVALNFGLSNRSETVEFDFSEEIKGSVGIRGLSHRDDIDQSKVKKIRLDLRSAAVEMGKIFDENKGSEFILKIDCEGSEYNVVEALSESGRLERVSLIMLEWHDHRRLKELQNHLTNAGFAVVSLTPNSHVTGMIYASQMTNRVP